MQQSVCMFVYNNFKNDARVLKEARTLIENGYEVSVIAVLDDTTAPYEEIDGIRVYRMERDPVHIRFLRYMRENSTTFVTKVVFGFLKVLAAPFALLAKPVRRWMEARRARAAEKREQRKPKTSKKRHPVLQRLARWVILAFRLIKKILLIRHIKAAARRFKSSTKKIGHRLRRFHRTKTRPWLIKLNRGFYKLSYNTTKKLLLKFHRQFSFLDYYSRSYKVAIDLNADIYHAHDLNTLPVAYWSKKKTNGKLIYDSHELYVERNRLTPPSKLGKYMLRRLEKHYIRRCDGVITVNESIADILAQRYGIPKPHVVMNTPTKIAPSEHIGEQSLRTILNIPDNQYILLYLGSMTFNRGLEKLIESMVYLPNCYLVFMGYGAEPYKEKLMQIAVDNGVSDRFSFFGPVASDEVTSYAASADIGVAPIENVCLSYYYCSPNKVFECLNAGLPVIASDFPELKRVVEQHEIGKTFDPADPKDIARAAKDILEHPEAWNRMKQNTIPASKSYNWDNEAAVLIELYRSVG